MKKLFNNLFASVRKLIAPGIVCTLLFTVVSCEKLDEEHNCTENCFSEETFTATMSTVTYKENNSSWLLFIPPPTGGERTGSFVAPVNLPEEYQIDKFLVNVTFRRHITGRQRHGYPLIEIVEIEGVVFTSRFDVFRSDDCGYLLDDIFRPTWDRSVFRPVYLPEKFRQEGLRVDVTFHRLLHLIPDERCGFPTFPIEIIQIMKSAEEVSYAETRITGGFDARIEDNPWQVLIMRSNAPTDFCGGAIIAPNFILTVGECVVSLSPSSIRVHAGIRCRGEANNNNAFGVSRIIPHPDPNVDVALLQLSRNIPFNNRQRAINFIASSNNTFYNVGNRVRVSGWGEMALGGPHSYAECLQAVYLTIMCNQEASNIFPQNPLLAHEMAANGTTPDTREGICHRDFGGALTILSSSGEDVHIGIASSDVNWCGGRNPTCPSIFVRTSHVAPWIDAIMRIFNTVISGSTSVCPGVTNAVFSIPTLPHTASVRWVVDAPLAIVGANNLRTVTVRHTGAATPVNSRVRAEISLNGRLVHTVVREVAVSRPVITGIGMPTEFRVGRHYNFTVHHNGFPHPLWHITPNSVSIAPVSGDGNIVRVVFSQAGNYTISVTVSNECGPTTKTKNITVLNMATCLVCGSPPENPRCPYCLITPPIDKFENPEGEGG